MSEREKFWIESFGSFQNGYNATSGGDGTSYIEYEFIVSLYKELGSQSDVANILGIDLGTVSKVLELFQIPKETSASINEKKYGKVVNQYDLDGKFIASFPSTHSAAVSLGKPRNGGGAHISDVCKGRRKTAYGYIWKYAEHKISLEGLLMKNDAPYTCMETCGQEKPCGNRYCSAHPKHFGKKKPNPDGKRRKPPDNK